MTGAAGVYRIYSSAGVLLYIGCAAKVQARITSHRTKSLWRSQLATWTVDGFDDRDEAFGAETVAIGSEFPRWNVKDRSKDHPDGLLTLPQIARRYPGDVTRPSPGTWSAFEYDSRIRPVLFGLNTTYEENLEYARRMGRLDRAGRTRPVYRSKRAVA